MAKVRKQTLKSIAAVAYKGKQARTGNSLGIRFDKALFHSHPEFNGPVQACIIAPGRMLVVAQPDAKVKREEDPVIASFLSFLTEGMKRNPEQITPLDSKLMSRITKVVEGVQAESDEDLGPEALI